MPLIDIDIEVYCDKCGAGLCGQTTAVNTRSRGAPSFRVAPCERCLETARDGGRSDGEDAGYELGFKDGEQEALSRIAEREKEVA